MHVDGIWCSRYSTSITVVFLVLFSPSSICIPVEVKKSAQVAVPGPYHDLIVGGLNAVVNSNHRDLH